MNKKRTILLLTTILFVSITILFFKMESPFGCVFWTVLFGFVSGLCGLMVALSVYLIRKKYLVLKILSWLPMLLGIVFSLTAIIAVIDYRILLPMTSADMLTNEEMEDDIEYLASAIKQHPGYPPIDSLAKEKLIVLSKEKNPSRNEYINKISGLVSLFQDGHSYVPPFQVYNKSRYLPLSGYYFDDGFYILNTSYEYSILKNKKLLKVNGIPIDLVFKKINEISGPENHWNSKSRLNLYLFCTNFLKSINVIGDSKKVTLTYQNNQTEKKDIEVNSEPFINWMFWAFKPIENELPISNNIRKPNYKLEVVDHTMKVNMNLIENISNSNTILQLSKQMDSILKSSSIKSLILDLRNNTGGNNQLYDPIIEVLKNNPKINKKRNFFVLISRNTFSAGVNFVDALDYYTNAILIGEPTGAGPTHFGDSNTIILPNSGVFLFLSTKEWKALDSSKTSQQAIYPDVEVNYIFNDYIEGVDPWERALDSIVN